MSFLLVSACGSIAIALLAGIWQWTPPWKGRLPPGPVGLPIIGNLHQLSKRPWLKFQQWSHKYRTSLLHVNIAGQSTIIIGTLKAANDLLDKRSAIYSDRPSTNYVTSEILTGGLVFAFQHHDVSKRMRRGAHEALNNQVDKKFFGMMENEATILVDQILRAPDLHDSHLRRASASLTMSLIYGRAPLTDSADPSVAQIIEFTERSLRAAAPGAFLVNSKYFSWMKYLPKRMCGWRNYAEYWFEKDSKAFEALYADAERRLDSGGALTTLVASITREGNKLNLTRRQLVWLCVGVLAGGAETTSAVMAWFMLSMVLYPNVQRKAQEEIDRVIGRDRLPNMQDAERLPYIRALVREVMRWRTIGPLGIPHALQQDDVYEGHFLPRGSTILVNVWAIQRDPAVFGDNADSFMPERHLNVQEEVDESAFKHTHDDGHLSFGFGRRLCVGRQIANNNMFLQVACILWSFNISPGKDEQGRTVTPNPDEEIVDGLAVRPPSFPIEIRVRDKEVPEVISHSLARVLEECCY